MESMSHDCNTGSFCVRSASLADLAAVAEMESLSFPPAEAATVSSLAKRLTVYPHRFLLMEKEGHIVSFVNGLVTNEPDLSDAMYENAALHQEDGMWQMIFGVATHPLERGKGYASRVLSLFLRQACAEGRKGAVLTCKEALLLFYAKFGFVNEGLSHSCHGGVPWFQMRLEF